MTYGFRKVGSVVAVTALAAGAAYAVGFERSDTSTAALSGDRADDADRCDGGPDFSALAEKLGVSEAELKGAFEAIRPTEDGPGDFGGPDGPDDGPGFGPGGPDGPPRELGASLAKELGVSESELRKAFEAAPRPPMPDGPPGFRERGDRPDLSALAASLAKSLGLEQSKVEAALSKRLEEHEAEHRDGHREMAAALAKELGLSTAKVEAALEELAPHGR